MPAFNSKLPAVGTTIFTVMSRLALEHDALNLSQGFPDFTVPPGLLDRVEHHLRAGNNQYAAMEGLPALRAAIADKIADCYDYQADPETGITVTSGATEALFSAIEAFVGPGDEVIMFDPAYDSYDPAVRLAGGRPVHLRLTAPAFGVDWDAVRDALTPRTRMIMLNSPHNPTGAVLRATDLATLADLVRNTDVLIVSDEVYEHMVFDGVPHASMLGHAELAERSLVISSFGKTYHATGWKIGYCAAPPALTAEFRRVHQFVQFCVAAPLQYALADFLASDPDHYRGLAAFYQAKRDRFATLLADSRFALTPSAGTYFQIADYSAIAQTPDTEFTRWMTEVKGLAAIPVSVFYESPPEQRLIRFCFAKNDATLEQAAEILCKI